MFFEQIENFLPKKLVDGVALKTSVSQHRFFKLGVLKKQSKRKLNRKFSKIFLGGALALYLMGYQPTLAIPPLKQSLARAEFSQEQSVKEEKLDYPFHLPHPGYLSTPYSVWHQAVDIATGLGMPVHPIAPGKVLEVSFSLWGLGHAVTVEHEQGFKSTYGHIGRVFIKAGDTLTYTSILGEVGLTGWTSGPHTHLEITHNEKLINPQKVLPEITIRPSLN